MGAVASSFVRRRALRRLTAEEANLVGYAGPLVLFELGPRFRLPVIGRLQGRSTYQIVQHPDRVVMRVTAAELRRLGLVP